MGCLLLLFGASLRCSPTFNAHCFGYGGGPSFFRFGGPVFGTGLTLRKLGLWTFWSPWDVWYRMHQRRWGFWHFKGFQFISPTVHVNRGLFITANSIIHAGVLVAHGGVIDWYIEAILINSFSISLSVGSCSLDSPLLIQLSSFNLFLYIIKIILVLLNHSFPFKKFLVSLICKLYRLFNPPHLHGSDAEWVVIFIILLFFHCFTETKLGLFWRWLWFLYLNDWFIQLRFVLFLCESFWGRAPTATKSCEVGPCLSRLLLLLRFLLFMFRRQW